MPTAPPSLLRRIHPSPPGPRRAGRPHLVLGFDPGLHRTGYGALRLAGTGPLAQVWEAGVLTTRPGDPLERRLHLLHRDIEALLRDLRPGLVVLEDLFAHRRFPRTAIVLGHVRGVICLAAASSNVDVMALAPSVVKRAIAGSGQASKAQVLAAVRSLLGLRGLTDSHAADALALAYAGMARAGHAPLGSARRGSVRP